MRRIKAQPQKGPGRLPPKKNARYWPIDPNLTAQIQKPLSDDEMHLDRLEARHDVSERGVLCLMVAKEDRGLAPTKLFVSSEGTQSLFGATYNRICAHYYMSQLWYRRDPVKRLKKRRTEQFLNKDTAKPGRRRSV